MLNLKKSNFYNYNLTYKLYNTNKNLLHKNFTWLAFALNNLRSKFKQGKKNPKNMNYIEKNLQFRFRTQLILLLNSRSLWCRQWKKLWHVLQMISTPSSCSDSLRCLRWIYILRHAYQTSDILFYVLRYTCAHGKKHFASL